MPPRLVEYSEADWGWEDGTPYFQWRAARRDWCREHGFYYPGGDRRLPFGPLGDPIDMINAERAVRRDWPPLPGEDGYPRASG